MRRTWKLENASTRGSLPRSGISSGKLSATVVKRKRKVVRSSKSAGSKPDSPTSERYTDAKPKIESFRPFTEYPAERRVTGARRLRPGEAESDYSLDSYRGSPKRTNLASSGSAGQTPDGAASLDPLSAGTQSYQDVNMHLDGVSQQQRGAPQAVATQGESQGHQGQGYRGRESSEGETQGPGSRSLSPSPEQVYADSEGGSRSRQALEGSGARRPRSRSPPKPNRPNAAGFREEDGEFPGRSTDLGVQSAGSRARSPRPVHRPGDDPRLGRRARSEDPGSSPENTVDRLQDIMHSWRHPHDASPEVISRSPPKGRESSASPKSPSSDTGKGRGRHGRHLLAGEPGLTGPRDGENEGRVARGRHMPAETPGLPGSSQSAYVPSLDLPGSNEGTPNAKRFAREAGGGALRKQERQPGSDTPQSQRTGQRPGLEVPRAEFPGGTSYTLDRRAPGTRPRPGMSYQQSPGRAGSPASDAGAASSQEPPPRGYRAPPDTSLLMRPSAASPAGQHDHDPELPSTTGLHFQRRGHDANPNKPLRSPPLGEFQPEVGGAVRRTQSAQPGRHPDGSQWFAADDDLSSIARDGRTAPGMGSRSPQSGEIASQDVRPFLHRARPGPSRPHNSQSELDEELPAASSWHAVRRVQSAQERGPPYEDDPAVQNQPRRSIPGALNLGRSLDEGSLPAASHGEALQNKYRGLPSPGERGTPGPSRDRGPHGVGDYQAARRPDDKKGGALSPGERGSPSSASDPLASLGKRGPPGVGDYHQAARWLDDHMGRTQFPDERGSTSSPHRPLASPGKRSPPGVGEYPEAGRLDDKKGGALSPGEQGMASPSRDPLASPGKRGPPGVGDYPLARRLDDKKGGALSPVGQGMPNLSRDPLASPGKRGPPGVGDYYQAARGLDENDGRALLPDERGTPSSPHRQLASSGKRSPPVVGDYPVAGRLDDKKGGVRGMPGQFQMQDYDGMPSGLDQSASDSISRREREQRARGGRSGPTQVVDAEGMLSRDGASDYEKAKDVFTLARQAHDAQAHKPSPKGGVDRRQALDGKGAQHGRSDRDNYERNVIIPDAKAVDTHRSQSEGHSGPARFSKGPPPGSRGRLSPTGRSEYDTPMDMMARGEQGGTSGPALFSEGGLPPGSRGRLSPTGRSEYENSMDMMARGEKGGTSGPGETAGKRMPSPKGKGSDDIFKQHAQKGKKRGKGETSDGGKADYDNSLGEPRMQQMGEGRAGPASTSNRRGAADGKGKSLRQSDADYDNSIATEKGKARADKEGTSGPATSDVLSAADGRRTPSRPGHSDYDRVSNDNMMQQTQADGRRTPSRPGHSDYDRVSHDNWMQQPQTGKAGPPWTSDRKGMDAGKGAPWTADRNGADLGTGGPAWTLDGKGTGAGKGFADMPGHVGRAVLPGESAAQESIYRQLDNRRAGHRDPVNREQHDRRDVHGGPSNRQHDDRRPRHGDDIYPEGFEIEDYDGYLQELETPSFPFKNQGEAPDGQSGEKLVGGDPLARDDEGPLGSVLDFWHGKGKSKGQGKVNGKGRRSQGKGKGNSAYDDQALKGLRESDSPKRQFLRRGTGKRSVSAGDQRSPAGGQSTFDDDAEWSAFGKGRAGYDFLKDSSGTGANDTMDEENTQSRNYPGRVSHDFLKRKSGKGLTASGNFPNSPEDDGLESGRGTSGKGGCWPKGAAFSKFDPSANDSPGRNTGERGKAAEEFIIEPAPEFEPRDPFESETWDSPRRHAPRRLQDKHGIEISPYMSAIRKGKAGAKGGGAGTQAYAHADKLRTRNGNRDELVDGAQSMIRSNSAPSAQKKTGHLQKSTASQRAAGVLSSYAARRASEDSLVQNTFNDGTSEPNPEPSPGVDDGLSGLPSNSFEDAPPRRQRAQPGTQPGSQSDSTVPRLDREQFNQNLLHIGDSGRSGGSQGSHTRTHQPRGQVAGTIQDRGAAGEANDGGGGDPHGPFDLTTEATKGRRRPDGMVHSQSVPGQHVPHSSPGLQSSYSSRRALDESKGPVNAAQHQAPHPRTPGSKAHGDQSAVHPRGGSPDPDNSIPSGGVRAAATLNQQSARMRTSPPSSSSAIPHGTESTQSPPDNIHPASAIDHDRYGAQLVTDRSAPQRVGPDRRVPGGSPKGGAYAGSVASPGPRQRSNAGFQSNAGNSGAAASAPSFPYASPADQGRDVFTTDSFQGKTSPYATRRAMEGGLSARDAMLQSASRQASGSPRVRQQRGRSPSPDHGPQNYYKHTPHGEPQGSASFPDAARQPGMPPHQPREAKSLPIDVLRHAGAPKSSRSGVGDNEAAQRRSDDAYGDDVSLQMRSVTGSTQPYTARHGLDQNFASRPQRLEQPSRTAPRQADESRLDDSPFKLGSTRRTPDPYAAQRAKGASPHSQPSTPQQSPVQRRGDEAYVGRVPSEPGLRRKANNAYPANRDLDDGHLGSVPSEQGFARRANNAYQANRALDDGHLGGVPSEPGFARKANNAYPAHRGLDDGRQPQTAQKRGPVQGRSNQGRTNDAAGAAKSVAPSSNSYASRRDLDEGGKPGSPAGSVGSTPRGFSSYASRRAGDTGHDQMLPQGFIAGGHVSAVGSKSKARPAADDSPSKHHRDNLHPDDVGGAARSAAKASNSYASRRSLDEGNKKPTRLSPIEISMMHAGIPAPEHMQGRNPDISQPDHDSKQDGAHQYPKGGGRGKASQQSNTDAGGQPSPSSRSYGARHVQDKVPASVAQDAPAATGSYAARRALDDGPTPKAQPKGFAKGALSSGQREGAEEQREERALSGDGQGQASRRKNGAAAYLVRRALDEVSPPGVGSVELSASQGAHDGRKSPLKAGREIVQGDKYGGKGRDTLPSDLPRGGNFKLTRDDGSQPISPGAPRRQVPGETMSSPRRLANQPLSSPRTLSSPRPASTDSYTSRRAKEEGGGVLTSIVRQPGDSYGSRRALEEGVGSHSSTQKATASAPRSTAASQEGPSKSRSSTGLSSGAPANARKVQRSDYESGITVIPGKSSYAERRALDEGRPPPGNENGGRQLPGSGKKDDFSKMGRNAFEESSRTGRPTPGNTLDSPIRAHQSAHAIGKPGSRGGGSSPRGGGSSPRDSATASSPRGANSPRGAAAVQQVPARTVSSAARRARDDGVTSASRAGLSAPADCREQTSGQNVAQQVRGRSSSPQPRGGGGGAGSPPSSPRAGSTYAGTGQFFGGTGFGETPLNTIPPSNDAAKSLREKRSIGGMLYGGTGFGDTPWNALPPSNEAARSPREKRATGGMMFGGAGFGETPWNALPPSKDGTRSPRDKRATGGMIYGGTGFTETPLNTMPPSKETLTGRLLREKRATGGMLFTGSGFGETPLNAIPPNSDAAKSPQDKRNIGGMLYGGVGFGETPLNALPPGTPSINTSKGRRDVGGVLFGGTGFAETPLNTLPPNTEATSPARDKRATGGMMYSGAGFGESPVNAMPPSSDSAKSPRDKRAVGGMLFGGRGFGETPWNAVPPSKEGTRLPRDNRAVGGVLFSGTGFGETPWNALPPSNEAASVAKDKRAIGGMMFGGKGFGDETQLLNWVPPATGKATGLRSSWEGGDANGLPRGRSVDVRAAGLGNSLPGYAAERNTSQPAVPRSQRSSSAPP